MASRWGPLKPNKWPQDSLQIPGGGAMPPVDLANAKFAQRESFTYSTTITLPDPTTAGQQFTQSLPTDQDGDFWCDQIYLTSWLNNPGFPNDVPPPSLLQITDIRTGRQLCYPEGVSTEFFSTVTVFQDKPVIDYSTSPLPDGFRSTSTLPQPFCFTRQGGILVTFTSIYALTGFLTSYTVDIAFGGWKEYAHASA